MKKSLFIFAILLLSVSGVYGQQKENPQGFNYKPDFKALKVDRSRLDRIDRLLQEYIDKGLLPHALTFVAKDGQVIHNKAFGWKDMEKKIPLAKDDIFRMYSQTKAMTTVALMTLFEQGKFQLDDPVSMYIPEMTDQVLVESKDGAAPTTRKAASPVRIRHLLSHSSGITGIGVDRNADYKTLEEYVKLLVKAPLAYDPGSNWNYHPASDVWGYLVEYFSGKPLQEYLREILFEPLDIKDMAYYYDKAYESRFVKIYRDNKGSLEHAPDMWSGRYPFGKDRLYAGSGSGLNGTIEGYARFCQMILNYGAFNNNRILGRRTIEMMAKDQLPHPNKGGNGFGFGLGFQIYPEVETRAAVSNFTPMVSPGALSWGGMANTDYIIDHKEGLIILLYTNRTPDTKVWEKFLNTVYQVLE
ncbi:serine hydrolase domain-containing protein [Viscerimonas tarda]